MKKVFQSILAATVLVATVVTAGAENFGGFGVSVWASKNGAKVAGVLPNTPAENIGLQKGDIILSINGTELSSIEPELQVSYLRGEAGSSANLVVERAGEKFSLTTKRVELSVQSLDASDISSWYGKNEGLTAEEINFLANQRISEGYILLGTMQHGEPITNSAENLNAKAIQQISVKKAEEVNLPEAEPIQNNSQDIILNGNAKNYQLVNAKGARVKKQGNVPLYKTLK